VNIISAQQLSCKSDGFSLALNVERTESEFDIFSLCRYHCNYCVDFNLDVESGRLGCPTHITTYSIKQTFKANFMLSLLNIFFKKVY